MSRELSDLFKEKSIQKLKILTALKLLSKSRMEEEEELLQEQTKDL